MEFVFESDNNAPGSERELVASVGNEFGRQPELLMGAPASSTSTKRTSRRSLPKDFNDIDFNEPPKRPKKRTTTGPKVNYVKPIKKSRKKSAKPKFEWTWGKFAWVGCALLVMRLVFMDSGILDYHKMNEVLDQKNHDLELLRQDNVQLMKEIHLIKTSVAHQKKLTRDHLGVIADDEYLILFAADGSLNSY